MSSGRCLSQWFPTFFFQSRTHRLGETTDHAMREFVDVFGSFDRCIALRRSQLLQQFRDVSLCYSQLPTTDLQTATRSAAVIIFTHRTTFAPKHAVCYVTNNDQQMSLFFFSRCQFPIRSQLPQYS